MSALLSLSQGSVQPRPKVHPKFASKYAQFKKFMNQAEDKTVEYNCWKCGKPQSTFVFEERHYTLARGCEDNIDETIADNCGSDEKQCTLSGCPPRKYSNWDMEFEYGTQWEKNNDEFIYYKWNDWGVSADMTDASSVCLKSRLKSRIEFEKIIIADKVVHFNLLHLGIIDKVNKYVLEGGLRRLQFYLKVVEYYDRFNKYGDCNIPSTPYGLCYGCGVKWYLKTQYERSYIGKQARHVMNLVDYHCNKDDEDNVFVCGFCIQQCHDRAEENYYKNAKRTLMYADKKDWSSLSRKDQIVFALQRLDHEKYPIHCGWYDMVEEEWCIGEVQKVVNIDKCTILVKRLKCSHPWDKYQVLCFSTRSKQEWFLFQRPSCSGSPLSDNKMSLKFMEESSFIIDTTNPQLCDRDDCQKMYPNGQETIHFMWKFKICSKGYHHDAVFFECMHTKQMYDLLKEKKSLTKVPQQPKLKHNNVSRKAATQ